MLTKKEKEVVNFLKSEKQEHLLDSWDTFNKKEKNQFINQVESIKRNSQKENILKKSSNKKTSEIQPIKNYTQAKDFHSLLGENILKESKVMCVCLAAGMGSRLQFNKPKGMFPIAPFSKKTFFEIFCNRVKACEKKYKSKKLYIAFMLSDDNLEDVLNYFKKNKYFSLKKDQVIFFTQNNLPFYDENHKWFFEKLGKIATGPDGNAGFFNSFYEKVYKFAKEKKIDYVNIIPVDNPIADPFDEKLLSFHKKNNLEVTIKCSRRKTLSKKVGLLALYKGDISVVEYFLANEKMVYEKNKSNDFVYNLLNIGIFCFSMNFIETAAKNISKIPFYEVKKNIKKYSEFSKKQKNIKAFKCERLIFDSFKFTKKAKVLVYEKEESFVALKRKLGKNGIDAIKKAFLKYNRLILGKIMKKKIKSDENFELDASFYYPTEKLIEKWEKTEDLKIPKNKIIIN
jgi:UDP-N-acetylglucosamine/UDP-N-acetylgalactosamine diphosphorylase